MTSGWGVHAGNRGYSPSNLVGSVETEVLEGFEDAPHVFGVIVKQKEFHDF